jgi:hypothetical protein
MDAARGRPRIIDQVDVEFRAALSEEAGRKRVALPGS